MAIAILREVVGKKLSDVEQQFVWWHKMYKSFYFNYCFTYELGKQVIILFVCNWAHVCTASWGGRSQFLIVSELLESFLCSLLSTFPCTLKVTPPFFQLVSFSLLKLSALMCHQFSAAAVTHQQARDFSCWGLFSFSWKNSLSNHLICVRHVKSQREKWKYFCFLYFLSLCFNNQALMLEGNYSEASRVILKVLGAACEEDMQKIQTFVCMLEWLIKFSFFTLFTRWQC